MRYPDENQGILVALGWAQKQPESQWVLELASLFEK
jgi:hypothetical protein